VERGAVSLHHRKAHPHRSPGPHKSFTRRAREGAAQVQAVQHESPGVVQGRLGGFEGGMPAKSRYCYRTSDAVHGEGGI